MDTIESISVVICAYNEERYDDLVAAVASVRSQDEQAHEVIVVVDHNPHLLERVRAHLSEVVVIENRGVRGLGEARNSGIAAARGAVVAFLDDDAVAAPDWLRQLRAGYEDGRVDGVGGSIVPLWIGARPNWFPDEFNWVVGCTYRGMPRDAAPVRNLLGCNMSFRRQVFERLGGFRLGYGGDETEFCIRLQRDQAGAMLLYQPRAVVQHKVPASRAHWRYFRRRCLFEGRTKAVVSWLLGADKALSSECNYTVRTLPQGVVRGLSDAVLRQDIAGLGRAGFIVAGLVTTVVGYASGRLFVMDAARERGLSDYSRDTSLPRRLARRVS